MIIDDENCYETGLDTAYWNGIKSKSKKRMEDWIFFIMYVKVVADNCLMSLVLPPFGMMTGVNGECKRVNGNGPTPFVDCLHQNIPGTTSIENITIHLEIIVRKYRPAVLIVSEVSTERMQHVVLDGYAWYRGNKLGHKEARVSLFVQTALPHEDLELRHCQIPLVGIKLGDYSVVGCYREWADVGENDESRKVEKQLERSKTLFPVLKGLRGKLVLAGDFNFCLLNENSATQKIRDLYHDEILIKGWRQWIFRVTRVQKNCQSSLLDHVYTKNVEVSRIFTKNVIGTDHSLVGVRVSLRKPLFQPQSFTARQIRVVGEEEFARYYLGSLVHEVFSELDPTRALMKLEEKITWCLDQVAPERTIITRPSHAPWMTPVIKANMDERDRLLAIAKETGNPEDWMVFKRWRNDVKHQQMKQKKWFNEQRLKEEESTKMWSRVQKLSGLKKGKEAARMKLEVEDGKILTEEKEVATYLNEFFKQKVIRLEQKTKPSVKKCEEYAKEFVGDKEVKSFGFSTVGNMEIKRIIKSLKNTGAMGRDKIATMVLKKFVNVLTPAIRHVVNRAILTSTFPEGWKMGQITPLPKKGSLKLPANWRPVVIMCPMSKVLESVLNVQLRSHLEENGLMSKVQHAYRKARSCQSAWLELDTVVQEARNGGRHAALVLTDQSAAFNLVKADIILSKLKVFGLDDVASKLIRSYLTGRSTKCIVGRGHSHWTSLRSGVGEGSVVGPLFFVATLCDVTVVSTRTVKRLKDMGVEIEVNLIAYADDVSAIVVGGSEDDLQLGIDVVMDEFEQYFSAAGLSMNPTKSELVVFRCGKVKKELKVGDQVEAKSAKLLGVTVSQGYGFGKHAKMVAATVRTKVEKLSQVTDIMDWKTRKIVFDAVILSSLTYCLSVWGWRLDWRKIAQKSMNSALRLLTGGTRYTRIEDMLTQASWLNLDNLWRLESLMSLRRLCESRNSDLMFEVLTRATNHRYMVRQDGLKLGWNPRNSHGHNAFIWTAVKEANVLRMPQRTWYDDRKGMKMTNSQIRSTLKSELIDLYGNDNL